MLARRLATRAIASVNVLEPKSPGTPSETERSKWPDPEAIDARQRGDGVGVLDALRGLDLAEERAAPVGGDELVHDRAGAIAVVRDLQGDAAPAIRRVFHRVDDVAGFLRIADHRQHEALGAHVQARAM